MSPAPFESFARDFEDVILWRALGHVPDGRFLEVPADVDQAHSRIGGLRQRGWSPAGERPGPLHVLSVLDADVLASSLEDLRARGIRPLVVVVAAAPHRRALELDDGYQHCLYTGVSDVFLDQRAPETTPELAHDLSYPACSRDAFTTAAERSLRTQLETSRGATARWRSTAVAGWQNQSTAGAKTGPRDRLFDIYRALPAGIRRPLRAILVASRLGPRE